MSNTSLFAKPKFWVLTSGLLASMLVVHLPPAAAQFGFGGGRGGGLNFNFGSGGNRGGSHYGEGHGSGRSGGGVNWGSVIGNAIGSMAREANRYPQQPQYVPQQQYVPQEQYLPQPQTVLKPVVPKTNIVRVSLPKQPSWLAGRVSEMSKREAQSYAKELGTEAAKQLQKLVEALRNAGGDPAKIDEQVQALQRLLGTNATWRDLDPIIAALSQQINGLNNAGLTQQLRFVIEILAARDAFVVIVVSDPRVRAGAIPVAAIPTGIIRVLIDPTLPAGTGLFVNSVTMVCGTGGEGEMGVVTTTAAEALGLPVVPGDPLPDMSDADAQKLAASGVVIGNREDAGAAVNYVLDSRFPYTIQPSQRQALPGGKTWLIEFDRGNSSGNARYTLSEGYYEFRVAQAGWELGRKSFNITLDNRDGVTDFGYVADNKVVMVKAGEVQTVQSDSPLIIRFDRGEGPEKAAIKNLNKSGTYKVAVNTNTNYLDLYAVVEAKPEPMVAQDQEAPK